MKLIQLIQKPQNRGAEIFTTQLSNHLINEGHNVKVIAIFNGTSKLPFRDDIEILNGSHKKRFYDYLAWKKLASIITEFQPDVVQANAGDTLKYAVFSKIIFRWKQPIVFRNASEVGRYIKTSLQKEINTFLYRNVDWVISVSQASKTDIINYFPFLKNKVDVVGVGLESVSRQEIKLLIPPSHKHIVHVGGFTFEKNHKGLIEIFQLVLKEEPNTHLHLVGDGPLRSKMQELVNSSSLKNNITFYGFVSDPLSYITAADVLVLPSIIEGLPGVILEAMDCKTPVIAFNVGGISEILNKETGYLIPPGDNNSFRNAIIEIFNNDVSDKVMTAKNLVRSNFMNSTLSLKFVNIYEKLVATLE